MKRFSFRAVAIAAGMLVSLAAGSLPAAAQERAIVATEVIYPGQTVGARSLREVGLNRQPSGGTAFVKTAEEIDGKVARRTILPGRLIPIDSVREAHLVETGNPVKVEFIEGALVISMRAVPLQSGAAGDMVKLRNTNGGSVFTGTVMADGTVRVGET